MLLLGFGSGASAASNTYKVKRGDSLSKIGKTYHITVSQLKKWNHLSSDLIKVNEVLKIANPGTSVSTKTAVKAASRSSQTARVLTVSASAYTLNFANCTGITATGINLRKNPNQKVISVDPRVIKLGSKVYVPGYGYAIAADTGGAIKGNKIDVFIPSEKAAIQWGRKTLKIQILN
jgi:3D (Asp-Asp-Asp) domain-containing protein